MKTPSDHHQAAQGFTLIEVIVALVVCAILATILVSALGSSFMNSSQPIFRLQKTMALHQVLENIRADFAITNDTALLKTSIGDTGLQSTGYGTYEVAENRYITFVNDATPPAMIEADGVASDGILKVMLRDPETGMVLTEFFVEW